MMNLLHAIGLAGVLEVPAICLSFLPSSEQWIMPDCMYLKNRNRTKYGIILFIEQSYTKYGIILFIEQSYTIGCGCNMQPIMYHAGLVVLFSGWF